MLSRLRAGAMALLLAMVLATRAGAGDLTPEEQRWAKDAVAALGANSPRVRKGAEEALTRLGVDALPSIAEALPQLKGEAALKGLRRSLEAMGRADVTAALARLAQGASTRAAAKRFEDVAAILGGGAGSDVPNSLPLVAARLEDWTLAPLALERPIRGRLPADLVSGAYVAEEQAGTLRVDADGNGSMEAAVPAALGRVLEVGPPDRKVLLLVYSKPDGKGGAGWFACPASILRGGTGSNAVEILDADLNGDFMGSGDFIRTADGTFGLPGAERRILLEDGVYTYQVVHETAGWRLALVHEAPPAGFDDGAQEGLLALDRWRRTLGLPPARLDAARCDGCKKHALYLQRNAGSAEVQGLGGHGETEGKPGYTREGALAGGNSVLSTAADPTAAVASFARSMLHGTDLLGSPSGGFGIGSVGGRGGATVLWGDDPVLTGARVPFMVPAPGQRLVPLRGGSEEPPPDQPPNWYGAARGFPVSVFTQGIGVAQVEIRLFLADGKTLVLGHLWTAEAPIASGYGGGVAFFMPAAPLEAKEAYVAVASAKGPSGDVSWTWSFRTD